MSALLVGYAQCSTDQLDLTAQRDALSGLGVETERIYRQKSALPRVEPRGSS